MIICVGSVFVDHIANIDIFPKKPIKFLANNIDKRLGGAAAVAALTVKKFDGEVEFVGRIGDDDTSHLLCTDPCGPSHTVALSSASPSVYANGLKIGCETDGYGGEIITSVNQSTVFAIT